MLLRTGKTCVFRTEGACSLEQRTSWRVLPWRKGSWVLSCRFPSLKDRASVWLLVVLRDRLSAWSSSSSTDITWPHGAPHRTTVTIGPPCLVCISSSHEPSSSCLLPVQVCVTCPGVLPFQVCVTCPCVCYLSRCVLPVQVCYLSRCALPVQVCVTCRGVCYLFRCVLPVQVCVTCTAECRKVARRWESMLICAVFPSGAS